MLDEKPLLSICIPTFNRLPFLERLLASLLGQVELFKNEIEIIISDNASTDSTAEYCAKIIEKYPCVTFFRNKKNEGSDANISKLYIKSRGRFVWIIGDDDYLTPRALFEVMTTLSSHRTAALIYMNSMAHRSHLELKSEKILYQVFNGNEEFIKKIGVFFTFISGVIVNKEMYPVESDVINRYRKTSLIQLSWVYTALAGGTNFIYVSSKYVIAQPDNTGGYKLFTVFAENLTKITNDFFPVGKRNNAQIRKSAMKFLLNYVDGNDKKFESENHMSVANKSFGDLCEYKYLYRYLYRSPKLSGLFICGVNMLRKIKKLTVKYK